MVEQAVRPVVRVVAYADTVGDGDVQAGIQGVDTHRHVLVAPAVLERTGVEYALVKTVGILLELPELLQALPGETEVAAPANHAGQHQVELLAEACGFPPCAYGPGHEPEVRVGQLLSVVHPVHVCREEVGRGHFQPGDVGMTPGSEHEVVVLQEQGILVQEVRAVREAVAVNEHEGVVVRFKERGDYRVAVPASPGEVPSVVQGNDFWIFREIPVRFPV